MKSYFGFLLLLYIVASSLKKEVNTDYAVKNDLQMSKYLSQVQKNRQQQQAVYGNKTNDLQRLRSPQPD